MRIDSYYCDECNEEILHNCNMFKISGTAIVTFKGKTKNIKTCHFCSPQCMIKYIFGINI